jgi:hypothetical protein
MQYKSRSFLNGIGLADDLLASRNKSLPQLLEEAKETRERVAKFVNRINSERQTSINNAKDIPKNATIRSGYVDCGKLDCGLTHGPYFYAYWKDKENGKLRKKYIGKHLPVINNNNADMTK